MIPNRDFPPRRRVRRTFFERLFASTAFAVAVGVGVGVVVAGAIIASVVWLV